MATEDETIRLTLEVKNQQALADLQARLAAVAAEERELQAAYDRGAVRSDVYAENVRRLTREKAALEKQTGKVTESLAGNSTVSGKYGQNLTALSYAVNDFAANNGNLAAKLNGVANNIPGMLAGLGPAGLGLALGALVPLIALVVNNWDTLKSAFGGNVDSMKSKVDELKTKIEELEKKPVKLAVDTLELDNARKELGRLEKAYDAFGAFQGLTTKDQKAAGGLVKEALENAPGGAEALSETLKAAHVKGTEDADSKLKEARAEQAKAQAAVDKGEENLRNPRGRNLALVQAQLEEDQAALEAAREKAQTRFREIKDNARAEVGQAFEDATAGKAPGRELLARMLDHSGKTDVAEQVRAATPEQVDQDRANKLDQAESDKLLLKRKAKNKALDAEAKELNNRGAENEFAMRQDDERKGIKEDKAEDNDIVRGHDALDEFRAKARQAVEAARKANAKAADQLTDPKTRLQLGTQGQIAEGTGGRLQGQALEDAAKRSIQLQEQGVDTQTANQQGAMETLALVNGLTQRYAMLQRNAAQYLRQLRQVQANIQAADQMTFQNMGGPN